MKSFGVEKTPALLVLHGGEVSKYDGACELSFLPEMLELMSGRAGPLKYDSLHKFLADFAQNKQGHKAKKAHEDL